MADAARRGADLVCLPEAVTTLFVPGDPVALTREAGGGWRAFFADLAREHRVNIAAPYYVRSGARVWNQCTLFHRDGRVAGAYRKVHPHGAERAFTRPGDALPLIRLDIGRVGVLPQMVPVDLTLTRAGRRTVRARRFRSR